MKNPAFVTLGVVLLLGTACSDGNSHASDKRIETLEARVAATDATATQEAHASATAEVLVRAYTNALATSEAQPTSTPVPTSAPLPPAPPPPPAQQARPTPGSAPKPNLSGSYFDQVQQAGRFLGGVTQTTANLISSPTSDPSWSARLRTNMLGYAGLWEAWQAVVPPPCAVGHHLGLVNGYGSYSRGAESVITALDANQPVLTAISFDPNQPPLLKEVRFAELTFEEVMLEVWGVSQQALDLGIAVEFVQALGLWGLDPADLGAMGHYYVEAGGAFTKLSGEQGACQ